MAEQCIPNSDGQADNLESARVAVREVSVPNLRDYLVEQQVDVSTEEFISMCDDLIPVLAQEITYKQQGRIPEHQAGYRAAMVYGNFLLDHGLPLVGEDQDMYIEASRATGKLDF